MYHAVAEVLAFVYRQKKRFLEVAEWSKIPWMNFIAERTDVLVAAMIVELS